MKENTMQEIGTDTRWKWILLSCIAILVGIFLFAISKAQGLQQESPIIWRYLIESPTVKMFGRNFTQREQKILNYHSIGEHRKYFFAKSIGITEDITLYGFYEIDCKLKAFRILEISQEPIYLTPRFRLSKYITVEWHQPTPESMLGIITEVYCK
jgi:hypothetical protein